MSTGLCATGVSHSFDAHRIIDDISLEIAHGSIACLLGPSGCGKTTLLRIIAGLERLQSGTITIGERTAAKTGENSADMPPETRSVGLMFQDYALFPHLTVLQNIAFGLPALKVHHRRRIEGRLDLMGLADYRNRYPHELSGGQQQRVALLRATAPNPAVLLLDEPFTGLDTTLRTQVRDQTLEFLSGYEQTTMMVTHDPEEAMYMADRLFVMNQGRIIQSGTPISIYTCPSSPFVASLFGPLNTLPARQARDGQIETPFGLVPTTDQCIGNSHVSVFVRPEHVRVADRAGEDGMALTILQSRSVGRSTQVKLATADGPEMTLTARVEGPFPSPPGGQVRVFVDPADMFVFANEES